MSADLSQEEDDGGAAEALLASSRAAAAAAQQDADDDWGELQLTDAPSTNPANGHAAGEEGGAGCAIACDAAQLQTCAATQATSVQQSWAPHHTPHASHCK